MNCVVSNFHAGHFRKQSVKKNLNYFLKCIKNLSVCMNMGYVGMKLSVMQRFEVEYEQTIHLSYS